MSDPEFFDDIYDNYARWALSYWKWKKYCRVKKYGFLNSKEKYKETSYESVPVDTIQIWHSTNRFLLFDNVDRILLTESNNTQTLIFPNSFKSDTKTVRKIVARELGFICMNIRSHLLEDQYKSSFTKEKIQESNTGGFFGNLMTGLNVIGMITEQSEREKVKKQELDDVWKVASAILVPINAIIVFNKQKSIKKYTHIPELFDVTDDILNTYLVRVRDKIYKYY